MTCLVSEHMKRARYAYSYGYYENFSSTLCPSRPLYYGVPAWFDTSFEPCESTVSWSTLSFPWWSRSKLHNQSTLRIDGSTSIIDCAAAEPRIRIGSIDGRRHDQENLEAKSSRHLCIPCLLADVYGPFLVCTACRTVFTFQCFYQSGTR